MKLSEILTHIPNIIDRGDHSSDPPITAIPAEDSRAVKPGSIFVARAGTSTDGHDYIKSAIDSGAVAIIGERPTNAVDCPLPYIQVTDGGLTLAHISAAYFGFPARQMTMIGVTGTDGKTSTANLIYAMLKAADIKTGMISTINAILGDEDVPTGLHVTTPIAPETQGYLRQMVDAGLTHCILEATSHGLAQHRAGACDFDIAVITNIQHEHLDFHGSWENYRDAKALLFHDLLGGFRKIGIPKIAVINRDDANSVDHLLGILADRHLVYAVGDSAGEVLATHVKYSASATLIDLRLPDGGTMQINSPLVGAFNVSNILAAVSVGIGLGIGTDTIKQGIESVTGVSGRMQRIDEGQDFLALVDFAHTPNALKRALEAARLMIAPENKVIAIFGSAGLRDPEKRAMMGDIAARFADLTIITAEDPRTEPLDEIMAVSAAAAVKAGGVEGETFWRIADRGEAIYRATQMASAGDIVISCGKGHEQSMCFGTIEYDWDDREAMRAALQGEPLKTLPTAKK